jgi:hypothetical protein
MSKRERKSISAGEGNICRYCQTRMDRFAHPPQWKPKPRQPYYFLWWDICPDCKRIFTYEEAKRSSWRHVGYIPTEDRQEAKETDALVGEC